MGSSTYKANEIFAKELEDELMKFTKKDEDCKIEARSIEQTGEIPRKVDVEVNITECTRSLGTKTFEGEYRDTTESSSSFDGSDCDVDTFGGSESLPDFCDDAASLDFSGFGEKFGIRKKKVTPHWRSYIQPLMWRCKWAELEMKKLHSLAEKYDHEIQACNKQKEIQLENTTTEDGTKSLPFSFIGSGPNIMKRKKRKRTEATTNVAEYMSHHSLFSYYEDKKPLSERALMSNKSKNLAIPKVNIDDEFWVNDDQLSIGSDNPLEHLLGRIGQLESQVSSLKSRANKVTKENASKISLPDMLNLPKSSNSSLPNYVDGSAVGSYIASQLRSMGDTLIPESFVTSHGDAVHDTSETMTRACFVAHRNVDDGVLIDNQRVKEEMDTFEEVKIQPVQQMLERKDGLCNIAKEEIKGIEDVKIHPIQSRPLVLNGSTPSDLVEPHLSEDDQPPPKIRSIVNLTSPKGTRKKGRRKGYGRRITKTR